MALLLAFAPFIAFVIVERLAGIGPGLLTGAGVSALLVLRDLLSPGRSSKILELGTFVLFAGLAVLALATGAQWPIAGVRLRVDAGLLAIVLVSLALRQPFTLQYAREQVPREVWDSPQFLRVNDVITAVWGAAFAIMVAADLVMLYVPTVPVRFGIIATVLAILAAVKFTDWYPRRQAAP